MANRFGSAIAQAMSLGARGLGYAIYWLLRAIYRPRERAIAIGLVVALVVALILYWVVE